MSTTPAEPNKLAGMRGNMQVNGVKLSWRQRDYVDNVGHHNASLTLRGRSKRTIDVYAAGIADDNFAIRLTDRAGRITGHRWRALTRADMLALFVKLGEA